MIYPANFKDKIGFSTIEQILRDKCLSDKGRSYVFQMSFMTDFEELSEKLSEVDEFKNLLISQASFPSQDYYDLSDTFARLRIEGSFIELHELHDLQASLNTIARIMVTINALEEEDYPHLLALLDEVFLPVEVLKNTFKLLNEEGDIADSASTELQQIRKAMRSKKLETDKRIRKVIQQAKNEGWISEDADTSVRNDRLVIPLQASHKRKIKGFVHDVSSTGQTVFIEPEDVFNLNNEIRELENDERLEIIKILKTFTDELRPFIPDLLKAYEFLGYIDFLRAKASFAIDIQAIKPFLNDEPTLEWFAARHPLLDMSLKKQGKAIVPLDIRLDEDEFILIISGPNAGGKSVCLKTVGLLQYMLQCGLLVPMSEFSEAGLFEHLFIDIGDQQSIENDLSTYSSHLTNMRYLIEHANEKTVFLADELGSGTEPQIGGAIAESILEHLHKVKAFGVVTTHYANLKLISDRLSGVVNGAMLFDTDYHKPLYSLKMGTPGSSFAMEMAKNIGLQKFILKAAEEKLGDSHLSFEQQLQQLEVEKKQLEQEKLEVRLTDELLSETLEKYNTLNNALEAQKKDILNKAKTDAKKIIEDSNKLIEKTIKDIKTVKADNEATKAIRDKLRQTEAKLLHTDTKSALSEKPVQKIITKALKIGDFARISEGGSVVEILDIKGKKAIVGSGLVRMTLPLEQLIFVPKGQIPKPQHRSNYGSILSTIHERKAFFNPSLDLRGKNAEEAVEATMKFLDDAILFSEKSLRILHGRGDGVLRRLVRDILQRNKDVESFNFEHVERGGDGVTLVVMK